jgi:hypothetical protein
MKFDRAMHSVDGKHLLRTCVWPVAYRLFPSGRQLHANCTRVAPSSMQHEKKSMEICMRLAATWVQFACDWRPLSYNLHATGGHSATRQETSRQEACKRPS